MRLASVTAGLLIVLLAAQAAAAAPVRVEILALQEQAGRISATVAVYGTDGQPVATLPPGSIRATLDGTQLPVAGVQASSVARPPISLLLVVDVSGSMYGEPITQARNALAEFVDSLEAGDQIALMPFSTTARVSQDFTADKALVKQEISRLEPFGDTALYDAVIEAARKAREAPTERKLIVFLSDGFATINTTRRAASLEAAKAAGISMVTIALGKDPDRPYLTELANISGGRFLDAPTPANLRQAYSTLAAAIRTQYAVTLAVPASADRTVAGKLVLQVTIGADSTTVEYALPPLAGAIPPPFDLTLTGVTNGSKVKSVTSVQPALPAGLSGVTVEYFLDGVSVHKADAPPYAYEMDPGVVGAGNHILKVTAVDSRGRRGEKQVPFVSAPAPLAGPDKGGGMTVPWVPILVALPIIALAFLIIKRGQDQGDDVVTRIKPWRGRVADVTSPMAEPPGEWQPRSLAPPPPVNRLLGRVIVMDEAAIKAGNLSGIREYEIGSSPLTLGSTADCDIIIADPEGRIAGEEARLWVQRGRLAYHKLTTLSAMATEGVTSGWQFLESGEDIRVGPCRLTFQLEYVAPREVEPAPETPRLRELWPSEPANQAPQAAP